MKHAEQQDVLLLDDGPAATDLSPHRNSILDNALADVNAKRLRLQFLKFEDESRPARCTIRTIRAMIIGIKGKEDYRCDLFTRVSEKEQDESLVRMEKLTRGFSSARRPTLRAVNAVMASPVRTVIVLELSKSPRDEWVSLFYFHPALSIDEAFFVTRAGGFNF